MTTRQYVTWLWIGSGVPVGIAFLLMPPRVRFWAFAATVILDTAHAFSPIVLAWSHSEFRRQVISPQRHKFVTLPTLVFMGTLAVGIAAHAGWTTFDRSVLRVPRLSDWSNPLLLLAWIYSAWNLYHFAMQHYGVQSIGRYRRSKVGCLIFMMIAVIVVPYFVREPWVYFVVATGLVSMNHWIVDIGLSAWVAHRPVLFIGGVLLAGMSGFLLTIPTTQGAVVLMLPVLISARLGLGLVHFLYSGWVWKLSDPQVRSTIGKELA